MDTITSPESNGGSIPTRHSSSGSLKSYSGSWRRSIEASATTSAREPRRERTVSARRVRTAFTARDYVRFPPPSRARPARRRATRSRQGKGSKQCALATWGRVAPPPMQREAHRSGLERAAQSRRLELHPPPTRTVSSPACALRLHRAAQVAHCLTSAG
eukprot:scaffold15703_cov36-Tisochrysis_lutea.AAC.1